MRVHISPPEGLLVYGQWYQATRFGGGGFVRLDVTSSSRGCNATYGRYRIHEWRIDPETGVVKALGLDFEQHCEQPTAPVLRGTLHYRATFEVQTTCTTPDPFVAMGGGTCHNGGWLPPGMMPPDQTTTPPPPPSTPQPTSACTTPDPFAAMGGGTCYNGGWLPPGMPVPGGTTLPPPPPPPPTSPSGGCTTPDPFTALGGGTCYRGGWLPPGMPIPGGG